MPEGARLASNQKDGQAYGQCESNPAQDQQALFFAAVIDREVIRSVVGGGRRNGFWNDGVSEGLLPLASVMPAAAR